MPDIIALLPDSVANQIAAGEVIQRPASVVKELVENAIDAGATQISVIIKDAGRTLIQIIDNGKGMSETDARMSFERHATSKIKKAEDLFDIHTMGFRGEALASIAAVAEVVLRTKREEDELGTEINIAASEVVSQTPVSCATGSNFMVKNLFYNIPVRRKFLKTDNYEFKLIVFELQKVSMAFPHIQFELKNGTTEVLKLYSSPFRQRIIQLFGKSINQSLVDVNCETSIIKITGYITKPDVAKKSQPDQFFFVNNRYMRHPILHKAIIKAYEKILLPELQPSYFICFTIDPANIDVNIHPVKTEIKFFDEQAIWQILHATVKESLGKFSIVPSIDFEIDRSVEIPVLSRATDINLPQIDIDATFDPFKTEEKKSVSVRSDFSRHSRSLPNNWQDLYDGFENEPKAEPRIPNFEPVENKGADDVQVSKQQQFLQVKNKYILTPSKSGLLLIDQRRAHLRILFEQYLENIDKSANAVQKEIFPQVVELSPADHELIMEHSEAINQAGFDIQDFGQSSVVVNGFPAALEQANPQKLVDDLLVELHHAPSQSGTSVKETIALALSKASAISYGRILGSQEMSDLIDKLFACKNHNYCPEGKTILTIISIEELESKLK
jgi:DNA mismatch repair protein MutL